MDTSSNKAFIVLVKHSESHHFQPRRVCLDEPTKIGRSVAKLLSTDANTIFDCKVLSRNHAIVSYEHDKFYIQDTHSSNGTFVNKVQLNKLATDNSPVPIYSGDVLQFGVNVLESQKHVTHHCIIAKVELINPDGTEHIQYEKISDLSAVNESGHSIISCHDLYKLGQLMEDAKKREEMLEKKLSDLQMLLQNTREATDTTWQAQINEDCLLTKIEFLESQLSIYSKNQTEDSLKQELTNLQSDKLKLETFSKEQLKKILDEKIEAKDQLSTITRSLTNKDEELNSLSELYTSSQNKMLELAKKYDNLSEENKNQLEKYNDLSNESECQTTELQSLTNDMEEQLITERNNNVDLVAKMEAMTADIDFSSIQIQKMQDQIEHYKSENKTEKFEIKNMSLSELSKFSFGSESDDGDSASLTPPPAPPMSNGYHGDDHDAVMVELHAPSSDDDDTDDTDSDSETQRMVDVFDNRSSSSSEDDSADTRIATPPPVEAPPPSSDPLVVHHTPDDSKDIDNVGKDMSQSGGDGADVNVCESPIKTGKLDTSINTPPPNPVVGNSSPETSLDCSTAISNISEENIELKQSIVKLEMHIEHLQNQISESPVVTISDESSTNQDEEHLSRNLQTTPDTDPCEPPIFDDDYEELAYRVDIIGFFSVLPLLVVFAGLFACMSPFLRWFTVTQEPAP